MITLLRGDGPTLLDECDRIVTTARNGPCLLLAPESPRAWNGLRRVLERLRELCGEGEVENVLARYQAAVDLIPGEGCTELRDECLLAARATSHLSHNLLTQRPFFQALASLVHELTTGLELTLVVPDLARLDRESLGLLRTLYRLYPDTSPRLVAGYDPERRTPAPDADGLIWENPSEDVWKVALGLMALQSTEVRDCVVPPGSPQGDLERRQDAAAMAPELPAIDPADATVEAMRASFAAFAFTSTLRLGLALLARHGVSTPEDAAEVHGLLALAAHNRQFRSDGNLRLADFLQFHLERALEAETRPAHRSAICYRLAVTLGRRKKDFEAGLVWADRTIREARQAGIEPAETVNLESWGRNIRAFALTGLDRYNEAAAECELAFERSSTFLERTATAGDPLDSGDACVREVVFTRALLADNLAAVAQMRGDLRRVEEWKRTADELNEAFPDLERFEARPWIDLYRRKLRLDAAADKARSGLDAARAAQDAFQEYRYTVQSADLRYRLGEAETAFAAFERAEELRRRLGDPAFLRSVRLSTAAAADRAGHAGEARDRALRALDALDPEAVDTRAQVLVFLGRSAARNHDADGADRWMNEAIGLAVQSGERDTLLAVAVAAGRASQHLGRRDDARRAYRQAVEIAGAENAERPAPAASEMMALLGLWETDDGGEEQDTVSPPLESPQGGTVVRCLGLLSEALEEAEAWWALPRVLGMVRAVLRRDDGLLTEPELATPLEILRTAASQRPDCAPDLAGMVATQ